MIRLVTIVRNWDHSEIVRGAAKPENCQVCQFHGNHSGKFPSDFSRHTIALWFANTSAQAVQHGLLSSRLSRAGRTAMVEPVERF